MEKELTAMGNDPADAMDAFKRFKENREEAMREVDAFDLLRIENEKN
jgi:hypothetical protein